jgi:hypothetical protein
MVAAQMHDATFSTEKDAIAEKEDPTVVTTVEEIVTGHLYWLIGCPY